MFIDAAGSIVPCCGKGSNVAGKGEGTLFMFPCDGASIGCPSVGSDAVVGEIISFAGDGVPSFSVGDAGNSKGSSVGLGPSGRVVMAGAEVVGGNEQVTGMTVAVAEQISRSASCSACD